MARPSRTKCPKCKGKAAVRGRGQNGRTGYAREACGLCGWRGWVSLEDAAAHTLRQLGEPDHGTLEDLPGTIRGARLDMVIIDEPIRGKGG